MGTEDSRMIASKLKTPLYARSALLTVAALTSVAPLIWLVCATLKSGSDLFQYTLVPWQHLDRLTLANYAKLFREHPFGRWMLNSVFLASTQTVAAVILASLGGFATAKYRFAGRRVILAMLLGIMFLPYQVLLPSSYELMHTLGWLNSYWAILAPGL